MEFTNSRGIPDISFRNFILRESYTKQSFLLDVEGTFYINTNIRQCPWITTLLGPRVTE